MSIMNHLNAGYAYAAVEIFDDSRLIKELREADRAPCLFSAAMEYCDVDGNREQMNWPQAFQTAARTPDCVLIVRDAKHVISNAPVFRALLDCQRDLKSNGSTIILVGPGFGKLPDELVHVVPVIRYALPTREQLSPALDVVAESAGVELNGNREALLDAAAGLTLNEAEDAFALSLVECGELDPATVQREKTRTINALGFLTVESPKPLSAVGGLGQLVSYMQTEVVPNCRILDLAVRGILLCSLPGCGKSLFARIVASLLGWPLIRLDVGACKGGLVGQSESNIRLALDIVEAVSPAVLWIDEVDKAVGGHKSSAKTDGGTTLGMVGHLLTWLQEHRKPIFAVATCNDFEALPEPLTRAGRFDERFVIDLPTEAEREAIATVHLDRLNCEHVGLAKTIAARTNDYSGAEIEAVVKSAARLSGRKPSGEHIETAQKSIKPLAHVNKEHVQQFRRWSKATLRLANDAEVKNAKPARKISAAECN